jgi:hypothetical protein
MGRAKMYKKATSKKIMQRQMNLCSARYWNLAEKPKTLERYNEQKQLSANYFFCRNAMDGI